MNDDWVEHEATLRRAQEIIGPGMVLRAWIKLPADEAQRALYEEGIADGDCLTCAAPVVIRLLLSNGHAIYLSGSEYVFLSAD